MSLPQVLLLGWVVIIVIACVAALCFRMRSKSKQQRQDQQAFHAAFERWNRPR